MSGSLAFQKLSEKFRDTIPVQSFRDTVQNLFLHSDYFLSIAAGSLGLNTIFHPQIAPQHQQQPQQQQADIGLSRSNWTPVADPYHGLHNHLPLDALRNLDAHVSGWLNGDHGLDSNLLRESQFAISRSYQAIQGLLQGENRAQQTLVLNLGNVISMADNLARMRDMGLTSRPEIIDLVRNLPQLSAMPEWAGFRAETLDGLSVQARQQANAEGAAYTA